MDEGGREEQGARSSEGGMKRRSKERGASSEKE